MKILKENSGLKEDLEKTMNELTDAKNVVEKLSVNIFFYNKFFQDVRNVLNRMMGADLLGN